MTNPIWKQQASSTVTHDVYRTVRDFEIQSRRRHENAQRLKYDLSRIDAAERDPESDLRRAALELSNRFKEKAELVGPDAFAALQDQVKNPRTAATPKAKAAFADPANIPQLSVTDMISLCELQTRAVFKAVSGTTDPELARKLTAEYGDVSMRIWEGDRRLAPDIKAPDGAPTRTHPGTPTGTFLGFDQGSKVADKFDLAVNNGTSGTTIDVMRALKALGVDMPDHTLTDAMVAYFHSPETTANLRKQILGVEEKWPGSLPPPSQLDTSPIADNRVNVSSHTTYEVRCAIEIMKVAESYGNLTPENNKQFMSDVTEVFNRVGAEEQARQKQILGLIEPAKEERDDRRNGDGRGTPNGKSGRDGDFALAAAGATLAVLVAAYALSGNEKAVEGHEIEATPERAAQQLRGGAGQKVEAPEHGATPATMLDNAYTAAKLSYDKDLGKPLPEGWKEVVYDEKSAKGQALTAAAAGHFVAPDGTHFLSFKGTTQASPIRAGGDWPANIGQHLGFESVKYSAAAKLGEEFRGMPIVITGHSLGGGLAKACAAFGSEAGPDGKPVDGMLCVTFNAASVRPTTFANTAVDYEHLKSTNIQVIQSHDCLNRLVHGGLLTAVGAEPRADRQKPNELIVVADAAGLGPTLPGHFLKNMGDPNFPERLTPTLHGTEGTIEKAQFDSLLRSQDAMRNIPEVVQALATALPPHDHGINHGPEHAAIPRGADPQALTPQNAQAMAQVLTAAQPAHTQSQQRQMQGVYRGE